MFAYDVGGNITSRTKYAYTTGTLGTAVSTDTYTYDTVNKDRLVSYNGQAITYDVKGNPLTYKGNILTWGRVRLLASYGTNTFAYNADGIRVRKNNTYYTLDGSNIMHEYDNSGKNIYYYYGVDGLYGFRIGETDYFYKKNLQGDITDIYHEDGTKYASYEYDAWGNCTITLDTNGIGTLNPFRYRGYYYDSETGLYYLKSRYYDPAVGRFLNQDEVNYLGTNGQILGYNLYGYCDNNPVMYSDPTGHAIETVFDLVTLGFSVAEVIANPYDPMNWIGLAGDIIDVIPVVTGVGEAIRGVRLVDKAGNVVEIAKATDLTDDAIAASKALDRTSGFTKSTKEAGQKVHDGYKYGDNFNSKYKEYTQISGIRPDYYDEAAKTIYELKPHNSRAAKAGIRQLLKYDLMLGGNNTLILELY